MLRSSRALALVVLFLSLASVSLGAQTGQQQPVQDLTPPSDAEAERMATPPAPNVPGDTANIPSTRPSEPEKNKDDSYTFRKDVEEVILYATVVDPRNRVVNDLGRHSFTVYEDGQAQQITSFRREDIPVSLGILIDNSGSMRNKRPAVNQAALNLIRASNKQDDVFIVNYNDEAYNDQDFTSDINLLKEGLEKVEARGGTAMYDAVVAAADHIVKGGKHEKKVLLVVTDGEDNASRNSLEEAVRAVQKDNGPTVYTLGILDEDSKARKRARRAMERLSLETGGVAYFPKDLGEVDTISNAVAHDIRNQYTIGYKPTRPQSAGGFRNVKVEARASDNKSKLQVRTRSGYFANQKGRAANTPPQGQ
ncbi:MAG: VWA domain-containing protein [Terriglobales bacterium]